MLTSIVVIFKWWNQLIWVFHYCICSSLETQLAVHSNGQPLARYFTWLSYWTSIYFLIPLTTNCPIYNTARNIQWNLLWKGEERHLGQYVHFKCQIMCREIERKTGIFIVCDWCLNNMHIHLYWAKWTFCNNPLNSSKTFSKICGSIWHSGKYLMLECKLFSTVTNMDRASNITVHG